MVAFQTLGELSSHIEAAGAVVTFPDAGVPLTDLGSLAVDEAAVLRNQPSVRKVTGFIARHVASVPFHLYERISDTDRKRVTDHPLASVLKEPRKRLPGQQFWHDVMMDRLIHDRFCLVWGYDKKNADRLTLTRIPARRTVFDGDGLGNVIRVKVSAPNGRIVELPPESCVLSAGYSPGEGSNGLSPMVTLRDILDESREAVAYRRGVWKNGARVPQVVERPSTAPKWSGEARAKFQQGLENYRKGGGAEGAWLLLEDDMSLKEAPAFRPKDTLDLEGRRLTDVEVASSYFVPPELVGAREGTYSNVQAFREMLYGDTLGPWFTELEGVFNTQMTADFAGGRDLYAEFNVEAKLRGSFETQAKIYQTATGRPFMTTNEARARQNLPEIEGGDELVTPLNVAIGGQASPTDVEGRPAGEGEE
ncbi:phage portal protein [Rhodococcus sp. NPDC019627]|uniref:phage portal protein n=1 Tax=unclassified Rhodococcus (in: high G+C Gram-positive bacteria) TaxID=192944 RepID=UPI00378A538E